MPAGMVTFLLGHWRAVAMLVIATVLAGYVVVLRNETAGAHKDAELATAKFEKFKADTKAASADHERRRAEREANDKKDKEVADAKHRAALAAARADADQLRRERDDARGRFLAEPPAGSRCPEGQVCFDGAGFRAAYGKLVADLRGSADRCQALESALGTAIDWAAKP